MDKHTVRLLACIPSYGSKNLGYLRKVLGALREMRFHVHIVVISNIPKDLGPDVEVLLYRSKGDPRTLPFAHKRIFADRLRQYDLFAYLEDDTLLTEAHVRAFLEVTPHLPPDCIAGFLRYEEDQRGQRYCSSVHSHYFWDLNSVQVYGGEVFARFANEHAACYLLTQQQLDRAIASGGFLVPPHWGVYEILETAATDP